MNLLCFGNIGNRVALVRVMHSIQSEDWKNTKYSKSYVSTQLNHVTSSLLCHYTVSLVLFQAEWGSVTRLHIPNGTQTAVQFNHCS